MRAHGRGLPDMGKVLAGQPRPNEKEIRRREHTAKELPRRSGCIITKAANSR